MSRITSKNPWKKSRHAKRACAAALTVALAVLTGAGSAQADRITAYTSLAGHCDLDNYINATIPISGGITRTISWGWSAHCAVRDPSYINGAAYLREYDPVSHQWDDMPEAGSPASDVCTWCRDFGDGGSWTGGIRGFTYSNTSDVTVKLFIVKPYEVWTSTSRPTSCILYDNVAGGATSVWCYGLYEQVTA